MQSRWQAASQAAISEFSYLPLSAARNEIRLLSLIPPDAQPADNIPPEHRGPVQCTIETVSLDDLTPQYGSFKSRIRPVSRRSTSDMWLDFADEGTEQSLQLTRVTSHESYHRFQWGDFGALSYTWGDQSSKVPFVMNGTVVTVGRNLEAALRALSTDPD